MDMEKNNFKFDICPKVDIVVLNWNNLDATMACLESVYQSDYINFEVIVIDNGSDQNPKEELSAKYPQVIFYENDHNLGYTGGNNQGIKLALERESDFIWLLNNDSLVDGQCLSSLIREITTSQTIGLVSPIICNNETEKKLLYCGSYVDVDNGLLHTAHNLDVICDWMSMTPDKVCLWGTALLINTKLVRKIGMLDEDYFAYFEDMDYSIRSINAGFTNKVVTDAVVFHEKKSEHLSEYPYYYHFYMARNNRLFWAKNSKNKKIGIFRHIKYVLPKAAGYHLDGFVPVSKALLDGSWNGLMGNFGEMRVNHNAPKCIYFLFSLFPRGWRRFVKWLPV